MSRSFVLPRGLAVVALALTAAAGLGTTGCHNDPYCLNCTLDGGTFSPDGRNTDVTAVEIAQPDAPEDTGPEIVIPDGCSPDAGEICNGVDDNCDGRVDEGFDVQTDPRNCGMCGHMCALPHAVPSCVMGMCVIPPMGCDTGFYDLDHDPTNGCEYACTPVPGATNDATCDHRDDNCNGQVDEDVNLCADPNNCGTCGRSCLLPRAATTTCARNTGTSGACTMANTHCEVATCEAGYYDLDHDPLNGCEYACTPTSPPTEVCDGRDNDCNGAIDEGDPGGGTTCGRSGGACRTGTNHCVMGRLVCMGSVDPVPETCNGVDDDCNGMVDDGTLSADVRVGTACGSGAGDCRPGRNACVMGAISCVGAVGPTLEVCDGRDNNCDGMIDNGVPSGGACGSSVGACRAGTLTCTGGTMRCMGGTGPVAEVCNGIDDDCDGRIDNGFDLTRDSNNCGMCGHVCPPRPNAITACQASACVTLACAPGFVDLNRDPTDGCEYACTFQSATEACNGVDDNCNGSIDEGVVPPAGFCRTAGACAGATARCAGSSGFTCSYGAGVEVDPTTGQPVAVETRCDGVDNNCNGAIDESFPNLGLSCANGGVGACGASGMYVCNAAMTGTTCNAPPVGTAGTELCDGVDNDCDGSIDENGTAPGTNPSFVSTAWVRTTAAGSGAVWMMQYEASRPGATSASQGTFSNRACSITNVLPWTNLTQVQAAAACTAAGARLCTETEWQTACRITTGACTWSYMPGTACGTYSGTTCNGVDNDIDTTMAGIQNGLLPTGRLASCAASAPGGLIYDLSGNAKEFTQTRPATTLVPLRGGSYNNLAFGTTCTFDWTVVDTTFRFVNAGFRCCFTGSTPP